MLERAGGARARVRGRLEPEDLLVGERQLALVLRDELLGRGAVAATAACWRLSSSARRSCRSDASLGCGRAARRAGRPRPAASPRRRRGPRAISATRGPRAVGPGDLLGPPAAGGAPAGPTNATTATAGARRRARRAAARAELARRARATAAASQHDDVREPDEVAGEARRVGARRRPCASGATSTTGSRRSPRTNASRSSGPAPRRRGAAPTARASRRRRTRTSSHELGDQAGALDPSAGHGPHLRVGRLELLEDQDPAVGGPVVVICTVARRHSVGSCACGRVQTSSNASSGPSDGRAGASAP